MSEQETKSETTVPAGQRIMWLVLAMLATTIPLWYELVAQPGNSVFTWRWTEYQAIVESTVSVVHLVVVIAGVWMLRKAVGDLEQWPMVRIGAWIWAGLVGLFALFSVVMYQVGDNRVLESVEGPGYRINFVHIAGTSDVNQQLSVVMSCNHTLLYKTVLYMDRLVDVTDVQVEAGEELMSVTYFNNGTVLMSETYSVSDFYQRCRASR